MLTAIVIIAFIILIITNNRQGEAIRDLQIRIEDLEEKLEDYEPVEEYNPYGDDDEEND